MTINDNDWCTVHYTTQDFTAMPEIGQLHKALGSKSCHLGLFFYFCLGPCQGWYI